MLQESFLDTSGPIATITYADGHQYVDERQAPDLEYGIPMKTVCHTFLFIPPFVFDMT